MSNSGDLTIEVFTYWRPQLRLWACAVEESAVIEVTLGDIVYLRVTNWSGFMCQPRQYGDMLRECVELALLNKQEGKEERTKERSIFTIIWFRM